MLYIVSGELTPESNKLYSGKMSSIGNMLGFVLGYIATQIWNSLDINGNEGIWL